MSLRAAYVTEVFAVRDLYWGIAHPLWRPLHAPTGPLTDWMYRELEEQVRLAESFRGAPDSWEMLLADDLATVRRIYDAFDRLSRVRQGLHALSCSVPGCAPAEETLLQPRPDDGPGGLVGALNAERILSSSEFWTLSNRISDSANPDTRSLWLRVSGDLHWFACHPPDLGATDSILFRDERAYLTLRHSIERLDALRHRIAAARVYRATANVTTAFATNDSP